MTCCYDGDGPAVFECAEITARKQHKCCECGRTISPGDIYENVSGCWDGSWSHYKTCERCADLREAVGNVTCVYFGDLAETYEYVTGKRLSDVK